VLFKCLAGRAPFEGNSVMAVLTKVLREQPPRLREVRPEVPEALEHLVVLMLQKDPKHRESAAVVAEALAAVGPLGSAGEAAEPSPPSRAFSGLTGGEQRVMAMVFVGKLTPEGLPESGLRSTGAAEAERPSWPGGELAKGVADAIGTLAQAHGGQIDRLADGTRVVTLSGSGVATDHAARAARLALALRAALPGVPMALATGCGDVARRIPVGDAIERAAVLLGRRVEAATTATLAGRPPSSSIAIDDITAALLGARFDVIPGESGLTLKGTREVEVGVRTLLGRPLPMVGREWELSSIETLFSDCIEEPLARPVLVTAAAGMGKSRLAHELVRTLRRRVPDLEVWMGRANPLRSGSTLGLLGEVIRSACRIQEGEALEVRRGRLVERVAGPIAEFLGQIVDVPFPDDISVGLRAARQDSHIMSTRLCTAWEALLDAATSAHPVLVVLEDLHWADAATLRFVESALSNLDRRRWMVLALARPEVHAQFPRLWIDRNVQEIRLKPLGRRAGERLVREALGEPPSAEIVERLVTKAEGNAFYLEELIRAVATGARPGALPDTVLAMVQARLEGLDAEARRVLRAASVFGEVFWPGGVTALLGGPPPAGWDDKLVAGELIARHPESRFAGEPELGFRHALLREGAYATLTEADRALGHRLAGEWLEARGESDPMVLAEHFDRAGLASHAAAFYLAAAWQALRGADPDLAVDRAERALAGHPSQGLRTEALSLLCEAHAWRADWGRCAELAVEVTCLSLPGSATWLQAQAMRQTASFFRGQPQEAFDALVALAGVEPAPDAAGAVAPSLTVGVLILCASGQFALGRRLLGRVDAVVTRPAARDPVARGWMGLAYTFWSAWSGGDFWAALVHARAAQASFTEAGDTRHARFAQLFVAMCRWALGALADAERDLRSIPVTGDDHLIPMVRSLFLALVLIDRGALVEARELSLERLATGQARQRADDALHEAEARWLLGEIAAREGDLAASARELGACLEVLRLVPLEWHIAAARLAATHLAAGEVTAAVALARDAREALRAQGGYGQRGTLTRLVYAEALEAAGDHAAARAEIADARDELGARAACIGDEATRRTFLEGVVENARVTALAQAWLGGAPTLVPPSPS
jgi:hypothetical protein